MKERATISMIAKIYSSIVSLFIFMMLLLISIFILLQNGLYFERISLDNVTLKGISIKWNDKIDLSIEKLRIVPQPTKKHTFTLKQTNHYIQMVQRVTYMFNSITLENIEEGNIKASFKYTAKENGYVTLQTPTLTLQSQLSLKNGILDCKINSLHEKQKDLQLQGEIFIDTTLAELYFNLNVAIHKDINLTLLGKSDMEHMQYKIISNQKITHLKYLIEMTHLPKEVLYWAYTAIKMKNVAIVSAHGSIDYNNIQNAYKQLYIKAKVNKLNYTYNPQLDAIHTEYTELEFKNGILYIRPKKAYSYGMFLNNSWLKIDFTKKEELLTLFLLFNGKLNKDMLHILDTYEIKLPFLQHSGTVTTRLKIDVNLRTIAVEAHGDFFTKKGNFDYLGLNLDIFNTHIKLNNYDVTIDKMRASLKKIAQADVTVKYNAKKAQGVINFNFDNITYDNITLAHNLKANYFINPKGDTIYIDSSQWRYNNTYTLSLEHMSLPFDIKTLKATVPTSYFNIVNTANGYISGSIDIKKTIFDIDIDILKFNKNGVKFTQSNTPLKLHYDKYLTLNSSHDIYCQIQHIPYKFGKFTISLDKDNVNIKNMQVNIDNSITTHFNINYHLAKKTADIFLYNFLYKNPKNEKVIYENKSILFKAKVKRNQILINSKELNTSFVVNNEGWGLHIYSLASLAKNSNFLQNYQLTQGSVNFHKYTNKKYIQFQADIIYPYAILQSNHKPVKKYLVKGKIQTDTGTLSCKINNTISLNYDEKLKIDVEKQIIDIEQTLLALKTLQQKEKKEQNTPLNLILHAHKVQLYLGNNRYVLADSIDLQYYNNILTAQLIHHKGYAGLKYQNNYFHLYGHKFDDVFMTKLLSLSKFYGGDLEFSFNGQLDDYKAVLFINNTTIKEYKLLNNILAFINTVPSLVTFSLPGYDQHGLAVKQAYINFKSKKDIFTISDIYLDSKELKIVGKGKASIKKDMIDIILNLKTDLGSNLSKIPLVGYILLDGDTISTTLKITGKLTNPTVNSLLAQDIAVAPLNIIKRTLTLPFNLMKNTKETLQKLK